MAVSRSGLDLVLPDPEEAHLKRVMAEFSTVVKDCSARDNSVMFAGPVADSVHNTFKVYYRCNFHVANRAGCCGGYSFGPQTPFRPTTPTVPCSHTHHSGAASHSARNPAYEILPMLTPQIPTDQYVTIQSKSSQSRTPKFVLAQLRVGVQQNWISSRIVSRFLLETQKDGPRQTANFNGTLIRSAGKVVTLNYTYAGRTKQCQQRFHVVRGDGARDKFDLLLGADVLLSEKTT